MRPKLRLTNNNNQNNNQPDKPLTPAPFSFQQAKHDQAFGFPFIGSEQRVDEVLRSLDNLSTTLDDLRKEIDALDDDNSPTTAA